MPHLCIASWLILVCPRFPYLEVNGSRNSQPCCLNKQPQPYLPVLAWIESDIEIWMWMPFSKLGNLLVSCTMIPSLLCSRKSSQHHKGQSQLALITLLMTHVIFLTKQDRMKQGIDRLLLGVIKAISLYINCLRELRHTIFWTLSRLVTSVLPYIEFSPMSANEVHKPTTTDCLSMVWTNKRQRLRNDFARKSFCPLLYTIHSSQFRAGLCQTNWSRGF